MEVFFFFLCFHHIVFCYKAMNLLSLGRLSQECNFTKVELHLIAIPVLLLSSMGRKNLNAQQTKLELCNVEIYPVV